MNQIFDGEFSLEIQHYSGTIYSRQLSLLRCLSQIICISPVLCLLYDTEIRLSFILSHAKYALCIDILFSYAF